MWLEALILVVGILPTSYTVCKNANDVVILIIIFEKYTMYDNWSAIYGSILGTFIKNKVIISTS
jgi:hypothetical protein